MDVGTGRQTDGQKDDVQYFVCRRQRRITIITNLLNITSKYSRNNEHTKTKMVSQKGRL